MYYTQQHHKYDELLQIRFHLPQHKYYSNMKINNQLLD